MPKLPGSDSAGPSEALRQAIEKTFEATVRREVQKRKD
jgi:hypothetical protein